MTFTELLEKIKEENAEVFTFTKKDNVLPEGEIYGEEYNEWSRAVSFLGGERLSMVTSEDLVDFEVIHHYYRLNINNSKFKVLSDNGESVLFGMEHEGTKVIIGIGPVDCVIVAEKNINLLTND